MKVALDRLFATLAHVHGVVDSEQLSSAYARHLRGESSSVLQALLESGSLRDSDRKSLEDAVSTCLARTVDGLLVGEPMARVREHFRQDPFLSEALTREFPGVDVRGHYRLEKVLGEGGMGRVWLANDKVLNRNVALKELKPNAADNSNARARFLREARVTGRLQHPFIVPLYEFQSEGNLYYAMRLVDGMPLSEAIESFHADRSGKGRFDLLRLLHVFANVCAAIAYAHSKGVIHRDLKPENVVLGTFGEVFVLDWGLAKVISQGDQAIADLDDGEDLTAAKQALGTPAFMSPEQADGRSKEADPATDVFGLGGILYATLTGRAPHARPTSVPLPQLLRRIATEPVPPACDVAPSVPRPLEAICRKALALNPRDRYKDPLDLAEDVRRWTVGEPVTAYDEPRTMRFRRWSAAHPRSILSAAIVVFVAVAATAFAVATWRDEAAQYVQLEHELATRAHMLRQDFLSDVQFTAAGTTRDAGSPLIQALVRGQGLDGTWAQARRRQVRFWESSMQSRPFFLTLALLDRKDPEATILRVKRENSGEAVTALVPEKPPTSTARKAIAEVLAAVDLGPGSHLVRRTSPSGSPQIVLVAVAPIDAKGHDAWLVSEFDFTAVAEQMVALDDQRILTVLRNPDNRLLFKGGRTADTNFYAAEKLGEETDPRLTEFFASKQHPGSHHADSVGRADENVGVTFLSCKPNDSVVHACKIHYDPQSADGYLALTVVVPRESYRGQSTAQRDFLLMLVVLLLGSVVAFVLLAGRWFRPVRPGVG